MIKKEVMGKENKSKIGERIISSINNNVKAIQWECIIDGCDAKAINSHILQKNGVLSTIESEGHIYEIKPLDVFKWNNLNFGSITAFKKIGLNQAHSYPTLCNHHDTELFLPIEKHPLDFNDYQVNLLFAFRTLLSMMRKEQIVEEKEKRIVNSETLKSNPASAPVIENSKLNLILFQHLLNLRKEQLERFIEDIGTENKNFNFIELSYPLKEVYCSSIHLSPNENESIYTNIFPYNEQCKILILFPFNTTDPWTEEYVQSWKSLSELELEEKLTTHLILNCENWGISEKLYNNISQDDQKKLIRVSQANLFNSAQKLDLKYRIKYNMFE